MRLIKLTSPELIEEFFGGEESVEVNESCKIVTADDRFISEEGVLVMIVGEKISFKELTAKKEKPVKEEKEVLSKTEAVAPKSVTPEKKLKKKK